MCWAHCPAWCSVVGSILLWGDFFYRREDFSFAVNMGSDSIPPKLFSDESINRDLVCAHIHSIARTQKILIFMFQTAESWQQKHTQHAPSTKTECDYLYYWIEKRSPTQKSHRKWWTQRYSWERRRRRRAGTLSTRQTNSPLGAAIAQLVVLGLAVHSVAGSILLWRHFLVEGIFPLELTWVQTPFPQKLFRMRV